MKMPSRMLTAVVSLPWLAGSVLPLSLRDAVAVPAQTVQLAAWRLAWRWLGRRRYATAQIASKLDTEQRLHAVLARLAFRRGRV
jgi:hypothetical protein